MPKPIRVVKPKNVAKNQAKFSDSRKQSFFEKNSVRKSREVAVPHGAKIPENVDPIFWLLYWIELGRQNLKVEDDEEDRTKTMSM